MRALGPHPLRRPESWLLLLALAGFGVMLFENISHPMLWQDEAETAVFATRILEYGYPKVHGPRNVVYEFGTNVALGIDERTDAYIGTTWGHFYFAVPGVVWARGTDDLYQKTARVRLPFALAGTAGLGVFLLAVLPVYRGRPRVAVAFAAAFFACSALSISLVLHLREARYYALLVLLLGALAWVQLRFTVFRTLGARVYGVALALLLVALFNTFFSAYFIAVALLGVHALRRGWPRPGTPAERLAALGRDCAPLLASAVCVAPLLAYYETFSIAAEFSRHLGLSPGLYAENLGRLATHLARHELLLGAVACRLANWVWDAAEPVPLETGAPSEVEGRHIVRLLWGFALGYAAIACLNPLVYERYFVVLSPVLTLAFLLDGFRLIGRVGARFAAPGPSGTGPRVIAAAVLVGLVLSGERIDDVRGRWQEIREPYRGPLDFAIPFLLEHYPEPERLVIATNYENHPYMYYLGSHVIVGLSRSNILADRQLEPDVVIPRTRWRSSLDDVRAFLARGGYREEALPIRDLHYNNVPALSASPSTPDPHRFQTAVPENDGQRLRIYLRVEEE